MRMDVTTPYNIGAMTGTATTTLTSLCRSMDAKVAGVEKCADRTTAVSRMESLVCRAARDRPLINKDVCHTKDDMKDVGRD